jgi:site-specific DNA-adenine methylase
MHDLFGQPLIVKTEPLGVPYMGGKRKYADRLITSMMGVKSGAKYFYDLFGGGGAVSFAALQKGMTVFYNEKQTDLVDLIRYIFERKEHGRFGFFPDEFYEFVSRERFFKLRDKKGVYPQFVRICYSFGNNQRTYLFNPEIEKHKHLIHDVVVFCDKAALIKLSSMLGINLIMPEQKDLHDRRLNFCRQIKKTHQLEQLEQLQRLQQLERLQRLEHKINFTNLDYRDVQIETPINETIVYLDPPYRGTTKYITDFDYVAVDDFFNNLPFTAFMSEYSAPFESIMEIKTLSTLSATSNQCKKVEKLFINRLASPKN